MGRRFEERRGRGSPPFHVRRTAGEYLVEPVEFNAPVSARPAGVPFVEIGSVSP